MNVLRFFLYFGLFETIMFIILARNVKVGNGMHPIEKYYKLTATRLEK